MTIEENMIKQGGVIKFHRCDYLKNDLSQFLISSLKKMRIVETKAIVDSTIMDSFKCVTRPATTINQKGSDFNNQSLFEHIQRSLNNLIRDNHFSCVNYNPIKLKIA
jgi:hypothetical protein